MGSSSPVLARERRSMVLLVSIACITAIENNLTISMGTKHHPTNKPRVRVMGFLRKQATMGVGASETKVSTNLFRHHGRIIM